MFKKSILLLLVFVSYNFSFSQVVINELDCDNPSTDDKEFIELKSTTSNFLLDGYVLVLFNGTGSIADKSYYVIDLDGFTTDINGIFVVGNQTVSPVPSKFLPESIFQNGPDGVGLYLGSSSDFPNNTIATTTNLVSALVYGTNDPDATSLMNLLGVTFQANESANSASTTESIQRKTDGTYETKIPTPGANNDGSGFIFNGVSISVSTANLNEGDSFPITFTTQTNVVSDLTFSFSLDNDTFTSADFTGNTTVFIPAGSNTFATTLTLVDDSLDEGDEVLNIKFGNLPIEYNRLNDNIEIRVVDNDFVMLPFGTPLNPTYGNVTNLAPSNYYSTIEGLSGSALKQGLQDIIANPSVVHAHNYGDITEILKKADQNPLNSNQVWLMYVEQPRAKFEFQTSSSNVGKWNREHIYAQSRGGFTDGTDDTPDGISVWLPTNADDIVAGHADAHHLRAEDGPENSLRSERNYGVDYNGPTGSQGSWHGDVARSIFYMAVRYNALDVINGNPPQNPDGFIGDLSTLLTWNTTDVSDDFEMNRNNYIYTWQVNRNPFIDHPNLADYIWGIHAGEPWFSNLSNNEEFDDLKVIIYPNPVKNQITISGLNQESDIEIYSISGMKLLSKHFSGETNLPIDLASGIYLAKITSDNKTVVKKIVVE